MDNEKFTGALVGTSIKQEKDKDESEWHNTEMKDDDNCMQDFQEVFIKHDPDIVIKEENQLLKNVGSINKAQLFGKEEINADNENDVDVKDENPEDECEDGGVHIPKIEIVSFYERGEIPNEDLYRYVREEPIYNDPLGFSYADASGSLQPHRSRRLKLQLCATDHTATGYAGHAALSCAVDSKRKGCAVSPSTRAMARASKEQRTNIKFVKEVEKYPCLYNYTLTEYSNKDITENAWQQVATKMKDTVNSCKDRWRYFRIVFVRKMKRSPSGSGRKSIKPYYLTEAMQFLLPYVRIHHAAGTLGSLPSGEMKEDIPANDDTDLPEDEGYRIMLPSSSCRGSLTGRSRENKRNPVDQSYMDTVNMKKSRMNSNDDSRKQFLLSLLPEVHAMNDKQMRKFRKLVLQAVDTVME